MACYHPLHAFQSFVQFTVNNKRKIDILSSERYNHLIKLYPDGNVMNDGVCVGELIDLPCGNCIGCRLEYSRQWAIRCVLEASQYTENYFVTLTYSPEAIEENKCEYMRVNVETGEYLGQGISYPLKPKDLTKFIKDLREHYRTHLEHVGIRFYACGEYGDKNKRPHFHILFFNLPIFDLVAVESRRGVQYYESATLSKKWGKGIVKIGRVTFESCAYVARYMTKKLKGDMASYYKANGLVPEFARMSRDPGIARSYYDKNSAKIYRYDQIILTDKDNNPIKLKPAKYFDRLYDFDNPEDMQSIKEFRKSTATLIQDNKLKLTDLDKETFLAVQEENKNIINLKCLKRFL